MKIGNQFVKMVQRPVYDNTNNVPKPHSFRHLNISLNQILPCNNIPIIKEKPEYKALQPGPTITLNFHTNMEYAEFTEEEIKKKFIKVYREILNVLDEFPQIKVSWDIETGRTINLLQEYGPDILYRIKKGIKVGRYEVQNVVAPFSLGSTLEKEDFAHQIITAKKQLESVFEKVSDGYFAQESAYSPELIDEVSKYVDFVFIRGLQTKHNSKTNYTYIKGKEKKLPCILFEDFEKETVDITKKLINLSKDKKEQIIVLAGDTEFFDAGHLRKLFKKWINIPNIKFELPSEYAKKYEPDGEAEIKDSTWAQAEFCGLPKHFGFNYGIWMWDDKSRQYLKHIEEARRSYNEAKFINEKSNLEMKSQLERAFDLYTLGTNSDNFGWNPCKWKQERGHNDLQESINFSESIKQAIYKINDKSLKQNEILIYNPDKTKTSLPCRIRLDFTVGKCYGIQLEDTKYDYFVERYSEDGSIKKAELYILETLEPNEIKKIKITTNSTSELTSQQKTKNNKEEKIRAEYTDEGLIILCDGKKRTIKTQLNGSYGSRKYSPEIEIKTGENGTLKQIIEGRYFNSIYLKTKCILYPEQKIAEIDKEFYFNDEKKVNLDTFQIDLEDKKITRENLSTDSLIELNSNNEVEEMLTANSFSNNGTYFTTRNRFDDIVIKNNKINLYHIEPEVTVTPTLKLIPNIFHLLTTDPTYLIRILAKLMEIQIIRKQNIDNTISGKREYHLALDFNNRESDNPVRIIFPENIKTKVF